MSSFWQTLILNFLFIGLQYLIDKHFHHNGYFAIKNSVNNFLAGYYSLWLFEQPKILNNIFERCLSL